jgi:hypothetical protein
MFGLEGTGYGLGGTGVNPPVLINIYIFSYIYAYMYIHFYVYTYIHIYVYNVYKYTGVDHIEHAG